VDQEALVDPKVLQEKMANPEFQVKLESLVCPDHQECQVMQPNVEMPDHQDHQERSDLLDLKVEMVYKDLWDHVVSQEHRDQ